jgi:hypothetical protein
MPRTTSQLQFLKAVIEKLDDSTARRAEQVVVVLMAEYMLVVTVLLFRVNHPKQPTAGQQVQRAIDTRPRHPLPPLAQTNRDFLGLEMVVIAKDFFENQPSLQRKAQPLTAQIIAKNDFFIRFHARHPDVVET